MKQIITTFAAIAGLAVLSQGAFGQSRQTTYATPPEPVGRYYNAPAQPSATAPHAAPAPQFRAVSTPSQPVAVNRISSTYNRQDPAAPAPHAAAPAPSYHAGCSGCATGCNSCSSGCSSMGCCDCAHSGCNHCCESMCCYGSCLHQTGAFADFIYLAPRNIDLAYAVPQNGIGGPGTVPVRDVANLEQEYSAGIRAGFNFAIDCCSSIGASFTWYETDTDDFVAINAPNVINPLVLFPGTFNAGFTAQQAAAVSDLEYNLVDVDYRAVLCKGSRYHVNYVTGLRYAHIEQGFAAIFPFAPPDGTTAVSTELNFDGGGIKFGLEGERRIFARSGLSVYSKATSSVLAGENSARYLQVNQFNGIEAFTAIQEHRVMTISEIELGLSWSNCRWKVSGGYYFSMWDNLYTTPEWIDAVQNSNFTDVSQDGKDSIAFDGFVGRIEYRF